MSSQPVSDRGITQPGRESPVFFTEADLSQKPVAPQTADASSKVNDVRSSSLIALPSATSTLITAKTRKRKHNAVPKEMKVTLKNGSKHSKEEVAKVYDNFVKAKQEADKVGSGAAGIVFLNVLENQDSQDQVVPDRVSGLDILEILNETGVTDENGKLDAVTKDVAQSAITKTQSGIALRTLSGLFDKDESKTNKSGKR